MTFLFNKIFEEFSFLIKKVCSSKLIIKGKCKQCGNCCRKIVFLIGTNSIRTEEQFLEMQKWNKHYNNFYVSGKDKDGALLFTCKSLDKNNKCGAYKYRSLYCRIYPHIKMNCFKNNDKLLSNCGFYIDVDKKFHTYLKNNY